MVSKKIKNENRKHIKEVLTEYKDYIFEFDTTNLCIADILEYIEQLETDKQKLIEKLEKRIKSVEKCYEDLIEPYFDKDIGMINTSCMSKKEKEEFINKRNCLIVQKHTYEEILEILKGEEK